jgi:hypothetical protein
VSLGHVPVFELNALPTCAVPVILGATVLLRIPATTALVGALVTTASEYPVRDAVTVRVRYLPRSAAVGVYVEVAPRIVAAPICRQA